MNAKEAQQLSDSVNLIALEAKKEKLNAWIAKYGAKKIQQIDDKIRAAACRGEFDIRLSYSSCGNDIEEYQAQYLFNHYKNLGYQVQYNVRCTTGTSYLYIGWLHNN